MHYDGSAPTIATRQLPRSGFVQGSLSGAHFYVEWLCINRFLAGHACLANLAQGGSPHRSQKLMRLRVLLQFVAIVVIMLTIWATR